MNTLSRTQKLALLCPFLLIPSTALIFLAASHLLGPEMGYVLGFLFYWLIWCLIFPMYLLGGKGVASLFVEENPLFQKRNLLFALLLVFIIIITVIMYPPNQMLAEPVGLLMIAIPVAIINGICEEVLWRGLYVRAFSTNLVLAVVYPSIGFALWHISPQLVLPSESGVWPFVLSTFFLGAGYGLVAFRTRSIRWTAISHVLGGILGTGGFIAPSIYTILTR